MGGYLRRIPTPLALITGIVRGINQSVLSQTTSRTCGLILQQAAILGRDGHSMSMNASYQIIITLLQDGLILQLVRPPYLKIFELTNVHGGRALMKGSVHHNPSSHGSKQHT